MCTKIKQGKLVPVRSPQAHSGSERRFLPQAGVCLTALHSAGLRWCFCLDTVCHSGAALMVDARSRAQTNTHKQVIKLLAGGGMKTLETHREQSVETDAVAICRCSRCTVAGGIR